MSGLTDHNQVPTQRHPVIYGMLLGVAVSLFLNSNSLDRDTPANRAATVSPASCNDDPVATGVNPLADLLQQRYDEGKKLSFKANVGVVCNDETTRAPIESNVNGRSHWFRLDPTGKHVKVVEIQHPTKFVPEHWATDPDVTVKTHSGVIKTDKFGIPGVKVALSNGQHKGIAVGYTAANS